MTTQQMNVPAYTEHDADELRTLITELLAACAAAAALHAPAGTWAPNAAGAELFTREAPVVIASLSRHVNQTRRAIRKITDQARHRALPASPDPSSATSNARRHAGPLVTAEGHKPTPHARMHVDDIHLS